MDAHGPIAPAASRETEGSAALCPFCLGPLDRDGNEHYSCLVGHRFRRHDLHEAAANRSSIALWSARTAVDAEIHVLRALAGSFGRTDMIDQADRLSALSAELRTVISRYEGAQPGS